MNSVFGMAQLSYREFLFLDLTSRNDWSSTLNSSNRSYPYYSAGLSWLISDTFEFPTWVSYAKVRGSYATVGKDAEPYRLYLINTIGNSGAAQPTTDVNYDIKRELMKSTEFGMDLKFLQNRFSLAYTYYQNNATNQIIPLPVNPATGFTARWINAGNIQNNGHELSMNVGVLATGDFRLDLGVNWSKNENKVLKLDEGVSRYMLGDGLVQVVAEEGGSFGDFYGYTFMRNEDGQLILNGDGHFQRSNERVKLGNFNPDWNAGFIGTFSYGNESFGRLTLNFLFDYTKGGDIYSFTNSQAAAFGTSAETAKNNREDFTIQGVNADGDAVTGTMTAQQYWSALSSIDSEWVYDKSEINLRELTLGYSLPSSLVKRTGIFKAASFSIIGRNLATFGSKLNGVPPYAYTTSSHQGAEAFSAPRTATLGFNLNLQF
jgi:hypothetical protein